MLRMFLAIALGKSKSARRKRSRRSVPQPSFAFNLTRRHWHDMYNVPSSRAPCIQSSLSTSSTEKHPRKRLHAIKPLGLALIPYAICSSFNLAAYIPPARTCLYASTISSTWFSKSSRAVGMNFEWSQHVISTKLGRRWARPESFLSTFAQLMQGMIPLYPFKSKANFNPSPSLLRRRREDLVDSVECPTGQRVCQSESGLSRVHPITEILAERFAGRMNKRSEAFESWRAWHARATPSY